MTAGCPHRDRNQSPPSYKPRWRWLPPRCCVFPVWPSSSGGHAAHAGGMRPLDARTRAGTGSRMGTDVRRPDTCVLPAPAPPRRRTGGHAICRPGARHTLDVRTLDALPGPRTCRGLRTTLRGPGAGAHSLRIPHLAAELEPRLNSGPGGVCAGARPRTSRRFRPSGSCADPGTRRKHHPAGPGNGAFAAAGCAPRVVQPLDTG